MAENLIKLSWFITIIALMIQKPEAVLIRHVLPWHVVPGVSLPYQTWSSTQVFGLGDSIAFVFPPLLDNVAEVSKEGYDTCTLEMPPFWVHENPKELTSIKASSPAVFNLESVGEHYFISTVPGHCLSGQKVLVTVSRAPELPPKADIFSSTTSHRDDEPVTHIVGDRYGWAPPPSATSDYTHWASKRTFLVGDKLVFNFVEKLHDVALVRKPAYEKCNTKNTIAVLSSSPATLTLNATGNYYFTTTNPDLCKFGQQLAITVKAR